MSWESDGDDDDKDKIKKEADGLLKVYDEERAEKQSKIDEILKLRPKLTADYLMAFDLRTLSRKLTDIKKREKRGVPREAKVDIKKVKALRDEEEAEATRRTVAQFLPRSSLAALRPSSPPPPSPPRRSAPVPSPPRLAEEEEEPVEAGESFLDAFFADGAVMKPISTAPRPPAPVPPPPLVPVYRSVADIPPPRYNPVLPTRKGWFIKKSQFI